MEAMAVPIKPGKLETWTAWCAELTGPRKAEFDDMNQRHGLTTHASWHQANPDGTDLAVIFDEETAGFPCIDCARVHIDAIVERLTS